MSGLEQRDEGLNQALDRLADLHHGWKNRLRMDVLRLGERYVQSELRIVLRYRAGEEYVALFERKRLSAGRSSISDVIFEISCWISVEASGKK